MSIVGGSLPRFLKSFNANNHTTGILSNFPGNEEMIRIAGKDVEEFSYNVAPLHGRSGEVLGNIKMITDSNEFYGASWVL